MGFYKKEVTADVRLDVRVNAAEKAEIKAVSYTHLTLPTKA